jgi:hypothetical protein
VERQSSEATGAKRNRARDSNESASMNIWLHKQLMVKLAANGGKPPPEIKR